MKKWSSIGDSSEIIANEEVSDWKYLAKTSSVTFGKTRCVKAKDWEIVGARGIANDLKGTLEGLQ